MEIFGRYIAATAVVMMSCILLKTHIRGETIRLYDQRANELTIQFVEEIISRGEITAREWEQYQSSINKYGCNYRFDILCGTVIKGYWNEEKEVSLYRMKYTADIESELTNVGFYEFGKGELVTIKLNRVNHNKGFLYIFTEIGLKPVVCFGGIVS